MLSNRERFCIEAIETFGIKKGDKIIMVSDFSDYQKYNGREVEVIDVLGADSNLDEVALPAYICNIDGEKLQLEGHELFVTVGGTGANANYEVFAKKNGLDIARLRTVTSEQIAHVYRFFDENGDFCHDSIFDLQSAVDSLNESNKSSGPKSASVKDALEAVNKMNGSGAAPAPR